MLKTLDHESRCSFEILLMKNEISVLFNGLFMNIFHICKFYFPLFCVEKQCIYNVRFSNQLFFCQHKTLFDTLNNVYAIISSPRSYIYFYFSLLHVVCLKHIVTWGKMMINVFLNCCFSSF